jgi:hypothetical protein
MRILKGFISMIIGIIFYPFITGYIMLENSGFFDKINKLNWVAIITYTVIGLMAYLWIIYVVKPLIFLISGDVLD